MNMKFMKKKEQLQTKPQRASIDNSDLMMQQQQQQRGKTKPQQQQQQQQQRQRP